jgi:catechol-2,3-dioxygenase
LALRSRIERDVVASSDVRLHYWQNLAAQEELTKRGIAFHFQDHEISHSIYFDDPDGHQIEITTYEVK